jgi:archaellum component FlaC
MSLTRRTISEIIDVLYDHKKHIERLDARIKKLEADADAVARSTPPPPPRPNNPHRQGRR